MSEYDDTDSEDDDAPSGLDGRPPRHHKTRSEPWYRHFWPLSDSRVLAADVLAISNRLYLGQMHPSVPYYQRQQMLLEQSEPELSAIVNSLFEAVISDSVNGSRSGDQYVTGQMQDTCQASQTAPPVIADSAAAVNNVNKSAATQDVQMGQKSAAEVEQGDVAMVDEGEEEDTATDAARGVKRQHDKDLESQV